MAPCIIAVIEGIKGPSLIFTPREAQTAAALQEAWLAVAEGEVDCALTGAADCANHPATAVHLRRAGLLADGEFPAAGAAYLALERRETATRDGRRVYGALREPTLENSGAAPFDPLAERMGRTFAAAPAIQIALALLTGESTIRGCGVDGQEFRAALEVAP